MGRKWTYWMFMYQLSIPLLCLKAENDTLESRVLGFATMLRAIALLG